MSHQSKYYTRLTGVLHKALGYKCKFCGSKEELELDVIEPQADPKAHHGKMSSNMRANFYIKQYLADNLQLLCSHCNNKKHDTGTISLL
jgi:5-methylcytosine-specific restriction endonuclease McrA